MAGHCSLLYRHKERPQDSVAVTCGLIPPGGQMPGPVNTKASADPARQPIGVFVPDDQEIVRRGARAAGGRAGHPGNRRGGTAPAALTPDPSAAPGRGRARCPAARRQRGIGLPGGPVAGTRGSLPNPAPAKSQALMAKTPRAKAINESIP
jgi:hypothetical protein